MAYRYEKHPPVKPELLVPRFEVRNGASTSIAFPCFYFEIDKPVDWHDHHYHDYIGWPAPSHPDHICQMVPDYSLWRDPAKVFNYVDMNKAVPIDLIAEGYDGALAYFDDNDTTGKYTSDSLVTTVEIDQDEPWVVRIYVRPMLPEFPDKPIEFPFSLLVHAQAAVIDGRSYYETYDEVARARIVVLPGGSD